MHQVTEKARHYGIATALPEVTDPADGLVLQYDLKIADGLTCGGAYLKFLTAEAGVNFEELKDDSAYTVMFGPDKCGATNKVWVAETLCPLRLSSPAGRPDLHMKHVSQEIVHHRISADHACTLANLSCHAMQVHLILRHKSPLTGDVEEKHLKLPPSVELDDKTHVYTAILHPNNTLTPAHPLCPCNAALALPAVCSCWPL